MSTNNQNNIAINENKKKKIVFFPFLTYGHVNVCAAIGNRLLQLYPNDIEIYFLQNEKYAPKAQELCPQAKMLLYVHPYEEEEVDAPKDAISYMDVWFQEFGKIWTLNPMSERLNAMAQMFKNKLDAMKVIYGRVTPILKELQPDLFIYDQLMTTPIGQDLGCPWGLILSSAPSYFGHWQLPPPISGLPGEFTKENVQLWEKFIDKTYRKNLKPVVDELNAWLKEKQCANLNSYYSLYTSSPFINIYNYPTELDYQNELVRMPGNWIRLESAVQNTVTDQYPLPEHFKDLPGHLVYVSLGSMASAYLPLMTRLLEQVRKCPHKFIVSLGNMLSLDELQGNMTGERFVDQQLVLNTVEVMVTHGGNNSLTECFHYGVPVIVLPLFGDQADNAQRVSETGFGVQLDPFHFTADQLNETINRLANDKELRQKYRNASNRIKKDNQLSAVAHHVADLIGL